MEYNTAAGYSSFPRVVKEGYRDILLITVPNNVEKTVVKWSCQKQVFVYCIVQYLLWTAHPNITHSVIIEKVSIQVCLPQPFCNHSTKNYRVLLLISHNKICSVQLVVLTWLIFSSPWVEIQNRTHKAQCFTNISLK